MENYNSIINNTYECEKYFYDIKKMSVFIDKNEYNNSAILYDVFSYNQYNKTFFLKKKGDLISRIYFFATNDNIKTNDNEISTLKFIYAETENHSGLFPVISYSQMNSESIHKELKKYTYIISNDTNESIEKLNGIYDAIEEYIKTLNDISNDIQKYIEELNNISDDVKKQLETLSSTSNNVKELNSISNDINSNIQKLRVIFELNEFVDHCTRRNISSYNQELNWLFNLVNMNIKGSYYYAGYEHYKPSKSYRICDIATLSSQLDDLKISLMEKTKTFNPIFNNTNKNIQKLNNSKNLFYKMDKGIFILSKDFIIFYPLRVTSIVAVPNDEYELNYTKNTFFIINDKNLNLMKPFNIHIYNIILLDSEDENNIKDTKILEKYYSRNKEGFMTKIPSFLRSISNNKINIDINRYNDKNVPISRHIININNENKCNLYEHIMKNVNKIYVNNIDNVGILSHYDIKHIDRIHGNGGRKEYVENVSKKFIENLEKVANVNGRKINGLNSDMLILSQLLESPTIIANTIRCSLNYTGE